MNNLVQNFGRILNDELLEELNDAIRRSKNWAILCSREDLLEENEPENLYKRYRVCGVHFEPRYFLNDLRNRLQPTAVPTLFPGLIDETKLDLSYCVFAPVKEEFDIEVNNEDVLSTQPSTSKILIQQDIIVREDHSFPQLQPSTPKHIPIPDMVSPTQLTQTSPKLSNRSPRKEKLRNSNKQLRNDNYRLQLQVCELEDQLVKTRTEDISLEEYKKATFRFCPSTKVGNFINVQVSQALKKPKVRPTANNQLLYFYF
ncbi:unnamed protein product [Diabrotica balteata]|uniref:THAP-type domain-containing protein n=1 Tax=Diabrotica balteata TaxID=107213 RepID=A0A9N9XFV9_DIABA|nr:unnamed protein product [Diabrotica balteata]